MPFKPGRPSKNDPRKSCLPVWSEHIKSIYASVTSHNPSIHPVLWLQSLPLSKANGCSLMAIRFIRLPLQPKIPKMSQSTVANAQRRSWYVQKQACLWQRHVVCSGKAVSYLHRIWNVLRLPDLLWDSNEKIAPKKSLADLSYHLNCHNLPYCMLAHPVPTNCRLLTETTDKQIWHMINGNICRCIKQWETETQWSRLRFADPSLCWKPSRALVHLKNLKTSHICLTEVGSKSIQLTHNYTVA